MGEEAGPRMAVPDNDRDGEHADYLHVRFQLRQDDDGWPPVASEGVWAVPLGGDLVRLDNIPWFARNAASGDTFRTSTDSHGVVWATDKVAWSGNCTVRVIPFPEGALAGSRQAVLDAFARLGVDGDLPARDSQPSRGWKRRTDPRRLAAAPPAAGSGRRCA